MAHLEPASSPEYSWATVLRGVTEKYILRVAGYLAAESPGRAAPPEFTKRTSFSVTGRGVHHDPIRSNVNFNVMEIDANDHASLRILNAFNLTSIASPL